MHVDDHMDAPDQGQAWVGVKLFDSLPLVLVIRHVINRQLYRLREQRHNSK